MGIYYISSSGNRRIPIATYARGRRSTSGETTRACSGPLRPSTPPYSHPSHLTPIPIPTPTPPPKKTPLMPASETEQFPHPQLFPEPRPQHSIHLPPQPPAQLKTPPQNPLPMTSPTPSSPARVAATPKGTIASALVFLLRLQGERGSGWSQGSEDGG